MKPCWVQLLLSREFTCMCVCPCCTCVRITLISDMSVYRNTAGFLILLTPVDLLCNRSDLSWNRVLKLNDIIMACFYVSAQNREVWECCTVQQTVEYHRNGVTTISTQSQCYDKKHVWNSCLKSFNLASAFLHFTHTQNALVCLLLANITITIKERLMGT